MSNLLTKPVPPIDLNFSSQLNQQLNSPMNSAYTNDVFDASNYQSLFQEGGLELPSAQGGNWLADLFNWDAGTSQTIGDITGLLGAGINAYTGFKQLGLAEDALAMQKTAYGDQKALTNADIASRRQAQIDATGSSNINPVQWT